MQTISLKTHVGDDGLLRLELPLNVSDTDLEVLVVVQPISDQPGEAKVASGWPPDFFEQTYGATRDAPLVRESEGDYEVRDELT